MTTCDGSWRAAVVVTADGVTTNVSKKNMRMWRNWQTRRFQVPVGDHMGSSPFIRTKVP